MVRLKNIIFEGFVPRYNFLIIYVCLKEGFGDHTLDLEWQVLLQIVVGRQDLGKVVDVALFVCINFNNQLVEDILELVSIKFDVFEDLDMFLNL